MKRIKLKTKSEKDGLYFVSDKKGIDFIPSGCKWLDLNLGGGWAIGRISNIVGGKSTGKTLLAMEACANLIIRYPTGQIYYHETESSFDVNYAEALGIPIDKIIFVNKLSRENLDQLKIKDINTVEGTFKYLTKVVLRKKKTYCLYIIDSLDALDAFASSKEDLDEGGYAGARKAGFLSEMFRKVNERLSNHNIHLMIVSQIRAKMNVTFGKKETRSGGNALNHVVSQEVWLKERRKIKATINKIERIVGVDVIAKVEKNKVGIPFRECEFPILLGYGVDEVTSGLRFLEIHNALDRLSFKGRRLKFIADSIRDDGDKEKTKEINDLVSVVWREVETGFLPKRGKYQ